VNHHSSLLALVAVSTIVGCFDSIVDDPCAAGFHWNNGACVETLIGPPVGWVDPPDAPPQVTPPDGMVDPRKVDALVVLPEPTADAPAPDAPTCAADTANDPDNCGYCGHVCTVSGLCSAGICVGEPAGHVVAIGHDYATYRVGMTTLLANAISIGRGSSVRVGWYRGSAQEVPHVNAQLAAIGGLVAQGRVATHVPAVGPASLANLDVVVIEAQHGDGDTDAATGAIWATALHDFLVGGGVAIVLEGAGGTSYRFAAGATLFTVDAPQDVTDQTAFVVALADAITNGVPIPYRAEGSSVVWPNVASPAIVVGGQALAFHRWVQ